MLFYLAPKFRACLYFCTGPLDSPGRPCFYSASDWFGFGGTELPFSRMMIDWISKRSNPTRPHMAGPSPSPALPCGAQLHVPYCYFSFLSLRRDCHVVHPPPNDSRGQKERCTTNLARINHFRGVFVICMYH